MTTNLKYRVGAVAAVSALGALLLPATANATDGFVCPAGTDTIAVPYGYTSDGQALLAGTVCVYTGTTRFATLDTSTGWTAEVKSDGSGSGAKTDVRFTRTTDRKRVELIYEPGRTVIK